MDETKWFLDSLVNGLSNLSLDKAGYPMADDQTLVNGQLPTGTNHDLAVDVMEPETPVIPATDGVEPELASVEVATHSQTETVVVVKDSQAPDVPLRIGRYRIVRRLGAGTAATVYEAFDELLARRVAIKLQRESGSTNNTSAFQDEARTLAGLEHRSIVPVYDYGITECNRCFVVSKLIDGTNLKDWMRRRQCSIAEAVKVIESVGAALDYSHANGVVHRDIKPANLLVDAEDNVYVADYGIALNLWEDVIESGVSGSPAYMSPEQARGGFERIDLLTDVFSLGVVFYELLTGSRPFTGTSLEALTDAIVNSDPAPPSELRDEVSQGLADVCLHVLRKAPSDRYQSCSEFVAAVKTAVESPTLERSSDVTKPTLRRNATAIGATAATLAILAGFAWIFASDASDTNKPKSRNLPSRSTAVAVEGDVVLPSGTLWGVNEDEGSLFVIEDLATRQDTTYSRGPILWSDGRRIQPLGEGIDAFTFDGPGSGFVVCNESVGSWRRPVLLKLSLSADKADVAEPIGSLGNVAEVTGLAVDPSTGELHGLAEDGNVFIIDRETADTSNKRRIVMDNAERMPNWEAIAFDKSGQLFALDDGEPKRFVSLDLSDSSKITMSKIWEMGHGADEEWEALAIHPVTNQIVISKTSGEGLVLTTFEQLPKHNSISMPRNAVHSIETLIFSAQ